MSVAHKTEQRRAAAVAFIRSRSGDWVAAADLAKFLDCNVDSATRALGPALRDGVIERQHIQGGNGGSRLSWRIAGPKSAARIFSIDWPPGFVPMFDRVQLPVYEARIK